MNKNYLIVKESLLPRLIALNFQLVKEEYHHKSFGSSYSVYTNNGLEIRIIWDGKDYGVRIDYKNQRGNYKDLIFIFIDRHTGITNKQIELLNNALSSFIEDQNKQSEES